MKIYYKVKYWFYIVWVSLRWIKKTCLGDIVYYKGKEYIISNGAAPKSWSLYQPKTEEYIKSAPRDECIKKKTFNNYFKNFNQGYNFYMTSWYGIWVSQREIAPWIKALKIWKK